MTDNALPPPEGEPPASKRTGARIATIVVAFGVFALAVGVFVVPAIWMRSSEGPQVAASGAASYPPAPLTGYYILFPLVPDGGQVIAITNLPEGTLYSTTSHVYGPTSGSEQEGGGFGCCPVVHNGYMGAEAWNESCNNPVGSIGSSSGFDVTIEVRLDFAGEMMGPAGFPTTDPTSQPDPVLAILGNHFENLTGDQVMDLPNAAKELVATQSYTWPEPQCGEALSSSWAPDAECTAGSTNADVDLRALNRAMDEVIGTISQARMCEFWQTMLTNDGRAKHPWPEFSDEWYAWYQLGPKNFSAPDPEGSRLTWRTIATADQSMVIDVLDMGTPVLELRMTTLQDCACAASMTPPWHVAAWTFLV